MLPKAGSLADAHSSGVASDEAARKLSDVPPYLPESVEDLELEKLRMRSEVSHQGAAIDGLGDSPAKT